MKRANPSICVNGEKVLDSDAEEKKVLTSKYANNKGQKDSFGSAGSAGS